MDRLSELGTARGFARRRVERARRELAEAEADCAAKTEAYEAAAACTGCGAAPCWHLWPEQRKCCPDCSHQSTEHGVRVVQL